MHKLQMYENLMDMLEREVKAIENKGNLDLQTLDVLYKIMMSIKAADKRMEKLEGEEMSSSMSGASGRMSRNSYDGSYARVGRDGDGDGRYSEDSFRSGANRGSSYDYSRNSSRDSMIHKLETLMDAAENDRERQVIMECINKIK